jgi:ATP-dependent DNA helicase PIF1
MTQAETLNILKTGMNIFLTGAAGSGKTHVLRQYLACLREHGIPVGVTASTGIAATHMGGITIHSWAGIGVKDELSEYDIEEIAGKENTAKRIIAAKVLIIDEVSMLHHYRLDMINRVLKHVRNSYLPFGGLQIIVCGDFFQLPPISRASVYAAADNNNQLFELDEYENSDSMFSYHSRAWKEANFIVCYLEEQFRQTDPQYLSILNAIRNANITKSVIDLLRTRFIKIIPAKGSNMDSADTPSASPATGESMAGEAASGSRRHPDSDKRDITFGGGSEASASPMFVPFAGMTSNSNIEPTKLYSHNANVDAENERELAKIQGRIFEYEMNGYGNKRLSEGLKKSCLAPENLRLKHGARVMFVKNNYEKGYVNGTLGIINDCGYDNIVVQTKNGRIKVEKETWRVEDNNGSVLAEIEQYPLRLAWAITIHKSQGMSLDAAHIDLSRSFERGMGYVALSRLRSLAGLHLLGLNDMALQVHAEALKYDEKFKELSLKQKAEFMILPEEEIKKLHIKFLGPEPLPGEKVLNTKKFKKKKKVWYNHSKAY